MNTGESETSNGPDSPNYKERLRTIKETRQYLVHTMAEHSENSIAVEDTQKLIDECDRILADDRAPEVGSS